MKKQPWTYIQLGGFKNPPCWEVSDGIRSFRAFNQHDIRWLTDLLAEADPVPPPRWKVVGCDPFWDITDGTQVFRNYQSEEYSEALAKTLNDLEK